MERETRESTERGHRPPRSGAWGWKTKCAIAGLLLAWVTQLQAQTCPTAPSRDVVLLLDNSGSVTNAEFDAAQQAIAGVATSILSRPGYRLTVVNWACDDIPNRAGCRLDLATAPGANGGWYTTASSFAYFGNNSASNQVCRSFGNVGSTANRNNCGGANFTWLVGDTYGQHALKMLDALLYAGGGTGGNDSYNAATVGPSAPTQSLMIVHMTDGDPVALLLMPVADASLGNFYYSNRLKNQRNAVIVGVGISDTAATAIARGALGATSSKGGSGTDYHFSHPTAPSTQPYDVGTPRLATYATTYDAAQIIAATNSALNATTPACVILRKQTVGGHGSFNFTSGTNGLPASLTQTTSLANNPSVGVAYGLTYFNTDASITETIPTGWRMAGAACVNASSATVPGVTYDPATGLVTIPAAQITSGAQLTCTVTNAPSATLRLQKMLPGGRVATADQFTLTMTGLDAPAAVTTTGSGSTASGTLAHGRAASGTAYTLSETGAAGASLTNYTTTYACTNARPGGQTPSGNGTSFAITPVAGDDLTCTFTNAMAMADVAVTKTASPTTVVSGGVVDYTLVVTNNGPSNVTNVLLSDTPSAGLDCTLPSGTATCAATGGASCPSPTVPVSTLLGSGITLPTLPMGGQVTVTLQCRVTASGL